jgi:phytoene dehydrogenase-like protein
MTIEREHDAIIIGSGHNGLILANYLAKAGMDVIVLEKRLEAGGGLTTEEVTLPGFYHNLHSLFHDAVDVMPAMADLRLAEDHHVRYVLPDVQIGMPLRDGRALTIHTDALKTQRSLARISATDSAKYARVQDDYREFMEAIAMPGLYSTPPLPSHQMIALEQTPAGLDYLRLSRSTPEDVVKDWFSDEAVRAAVLFQLAIPRGILTDYAGLGMVAPLVITQVEPSRLCVGGSHALAHGLWRALLKNGGVTAGMHEVAEILVTNGRASGVRLTDGQVIKARKLVASGVGFRQTFLKLMDKQNVPEPLHKAAAEFKLDEYSLFAVHLALNEPPNYTAAKFDPDVNRALKVNLGFESVADFQRTWSEIRQGKVPSRPAMYAAVPSMHDASQAPPGKYTALLWQPVPYEPDGKPAAHWDAIKEDFADRCMAVWREYAPNMDEKNIIKRFIQTPNDIANKIVNMERGGVFLGRTTLDQIEYFRPHPLASQYRTPVDGLYLCGGCTHPGGGILGAAARNAADAIAEDVGLTRWWS